MHYSFKKVSMVDLFVLSLCVAFHLTELVLLISAPLTQRLSSRDDDYFLYLRLPRNVLLAFVAQRTCVGKHFIRSTKRESWLTLLHAYYGVIVAVLIVSSFMFITERRNGLIKGGANGRYSNIPMAMFTVLKLFVGELGDGGYFSCEGLILVYCASLLCTNAFLGVFADIVGSGIFPGSR